MANDLTTVAGTMAERMAERLKAYRSFVARVARGEAVPADDAEDARRAMRHLGLPSFAFKRDVRAVRGIERLCSHRLAELRLNHPHLFDEPDAWVADRVRAIADRSRGGQPCPR
jgi:hypothetical protein